MEIFQISREIGIDRNSYRWIFQSRNMLDYGKVPLKSHHSCHSIHAIQHSLQRRQAAQGFLGGKFWSWILGVYAQYAAKTQGKWKPGMILSTHLVNSKMISHFLGPASDSEFQTRNLRVANTGCLSNLQPIKANPIQTNDAQFQSQPPTIHTPQWKEKTTGTTGTATTTKKHRTLKNAIQTGQKKSI